MTSSFQDCIEQYQNLLDKEWITIYEESKDEINDYYATSAIISGMSVAEIKDHLSDYDGDLIQIVLEKTSFIGMAMELNILSVSLMNSCIKNLKIICWISTNSMTQRIYQ